MPVVEYRRGNEIYDLSGTDAQIQKAIDDLEKRARPVTLGGAAEYGLRGANVGLLAQTLGAPVDLATAGINLLATGGQGKVIGRPIGGSESIQRGLGSIGIGYKSMEDVPEQYRPFAAGGEAVGASIPFALAPYAGAARTVGQMAAGAKPSPGLFAPITEAARTAPKSFAAAEALAAGASGIGGGIAQHLAPGDPLARAGGEIIGGISGPSAIIPLAKLLTRGISQGRQAFSPAARVERAATTAQRVVREAGEEPLEVAGRLGGETVAPSMTAAQRAGSPGLSALEEAVIRESRKAGGDIGAQTELAVHELNTALREAMETGDPQALRQVAIARERWWNGLIDTRLRQAEEEAARVSGAIPPASPELRAQANRAARDLIDDAAHDAYEQQRELWGRVDREYPIEPKTAFDAREAVRGEILPTEGLPAPIEAELARWKTANAPIPAWQVFRLRSRVLDHGRTAARDGNWSMKRHLDMIGDGLLDDLEQVPGDAAVAARAFSRALNDRLKRTYAKIVTGRTREGADVTPEQVTLERAYGSGGPEAAVRMQGMEEAVSPIPGGAARYQATAEGRPAAMRGTQETLLRDIAGDLVDPATGRVSPNRLAAWRKENRELLQRFPDLDRDFRMAETAQRRLAEVVPVLERGRKVGVARSAFARVAKVENPTVAFERAFRSDTPQRDISDLFRLAQRGGPQAQAGARAALVDALFNLGRTKQGLVEPELIERVLLEGPIKNAALKTGVMKPEHIENVLSLASEMKRFNEATASGRRLDEILDPESAMFDLLARISGANLGAISGQRAGASLVGAHVGSQRMRALLNRMPRQKVIDILTEAIQEPAMMAKLLKKRITKLDVEYAFNALKTIIYRAGIERPAVASRLMLQEDE